jgi:hypothetical protein
LIFVMRGRSPPIQFSHAVLAVETSVFVPPLAALDRDIGRRFIWRPGADVEISEARFGLFDTPEFRENPVARVYATKTAIRRRLTDPGCAMDSRSCRNSARSV